MAVVGALQTPGGQVPAPRVFAGAAPVAYTGGVFHDDSFVKSSGDIAGLAGAMVIADVMLDITPTTFIDRLHAALAPKHYLIGRGKAPVFALFIAVIGCRMGFGVERDTRSIGINTTSTVVQCIVAVIVLDALFAVVFQELGW